eukprot:896656-Rhodomonas_salina.1
MPVLTLMLCGSLLSLAIVHLHCTQQEPASPSGRPPRSREATFFVLKMSVKGWTRRDQCIGQLRWCIAQCRVHSACSRAVQRTLWEKLRSARRARWVEKEGMTVDDLVGLQHEQIDALGLKNVQVIVATDLDPSVSLLSLDHYVLVVEGLTEKWLHVEKSPPLPRLARCSSASQTNFP